MEIIDNEFKHVSAENQTAVTMLHYDADMFSKEVKNARVAFYILIIFNVIGMVVGFYQYDAVDVLLEGLLFVVIFLFALWYMDRNAKIAIIVGLCGYLLQTITYLILTPENFIRGIILKIVIIYYLVKGIIAASKIEKIKQELRQYGQETRVDLGNSI